MVLGDLVELVAVDEEVALAVGGDVHVVALDLDVAEQRASVLARRLVVVARDEHHLHVVARALEDLLHEGVLRRGPVHAAPAHRPEVDDVPDQEQVLRLVGLQEIEQLVRLAGRRAEVDIGDEERADALWDGIYGNL